MWSSIMLEDLRSMQAITAMRRGWDSSHTPRNLAMSLISEVGEISEIFQWKDHVDDGLVGWSDIERRRMAEELADVLLVAIRLADKCNIDLGEAALSRCHKLNNKFPFSDPPTRTPASSAPAYRSSASSASADRPLKLSNHHQQVPILPEHAPQAPIIYPQQQTQSAAQQHSPSPSPSHANGKDAKTVPPPKTSPSAKGQGGQKGDLSPHNTQKKRDGSFNKRPAFVRTLSVAIHTKGGYDPKKVEERFSPSHFDHNLFSPHCGDTDFEVKYGSERPVLPESLSKQKLITTGNASPGQLPTADSSSSSTTSHSTVWSNQPSPPTSPLTPTTLRSYFLPTLKLLAKLNVTPEDLAEMEVMFCVPGANNEIVDLIPNGRNIPVTLDNLDTFIQLGTEALEKIHGEKVRQEEPSPPPGASPSAPTPPKSASPATASSTSSDSKSPVGKSDPPPHPHKKGFRRTLSVVMPKKQDLTKVSQTFSPTHFDHDLFSPFTAQQEFDVEYGEEGAMKTLPRSLSKKELDTSALKKDTTPEHTDSIPLSPTLHNDCDMVIQQLEALQGSGELTEAEFAEYNVTFCIPFRNRTYDLLPNGSNIPVPFSRLPEFLTLAKQKRLALERSTSAASS